MAMTVRQAHRWNAAALGVFLLLHFASHLSAWGGIASHSATLEIVRKVYRPALIEPVLLALFAIQIALGIRLAWARRSMRRKGLWHRLQAGSGLVLAVFLVLHVGAALSARLLAGLDTNFYWPAGTLVLFPLKYGFAPYYVIAVSALFVHIGAALHMRGRRQFGKVLALAGPVVGLVIILPFAGVLYPIDLPEEYARYYALYLGAVT